MFSQMTVELCTVVGTISSQFTYGYFKNTENSKRMTSVISLMQDGPIDEPLVFDILKNDISVGSFTISPDAPSNIEEVLNVYDLSVNPIIVGVNDIIRIYVRSSTVLTLGENWKVFAVLTPII